MILSYSKCFFASILTLAFAGVSFAQSAPAASAPAAPAQPAVANTDVVAPRGATTTLDEMIQAKLDSMDRKKAAPVVKVNADSLAKAKADSIRRLIREGKYVQRARYDKSNFDHWKVDTVFQKSMKAETFGVWRTPIVAHGHAFRDAELRFGMNDTLYGVTRTYSDSGRYQMTGEYTYKARYRFDNDSSLVTREVFLDREVIRWDYIRFHIKGDTLKHNLKKLEFRDLNDNWLNALQGFDNIPPELYIRDKKSSEEMTKEYEQSKANKKK
ncbi:hypothetical protein [Fibrobacter sp. UBA4309]|uniref:hypothetical protein n=1 Tax=Fibrobacter sp. UBA4309 TaxID=1946537 RepID=UPI0025BE266C|nr:hypothetical protein [Fibrobacter sp. UBA4309]